jgi:predicted transcriptional regulator
VAGLLTQWSWSCDRVTVLTEIVESSTALTVKGSAVLASHTTSPLRTVRLAQGLSLRQTAARAGIDPAHLSRVERGERVLSLDAMHRLAVVLKLEMLASMLRLYLPDQDAL